MSYQVVMDHFPHAWGMDTFTIRNLPSALQKTGLTRVEPIQLHTVVDTDKLSFGFNVATRAVNVYGKAEIIR